MSMLRSVSVMSCVLVAGAAAGDIRLTHLYQFSTDGAGNAAGGQLWDTLNGGSFAIWISANGEELNTDNDASIDFELTQGSYDFEIWGQQGAASAIQFGGMNLFFNDEGGPGISVFAQARNDQGPPPASQVNVSGSTWAPSGLVPASGSLSYFDADSGLTVVLTDYFYANPSVFGIDEVSSSTRNPGGGADFYGQFTLRVIPAPSASLAALGFGAAIRRR